MRTRCARGVTIPGGRCVSGPAAQTATPLATRLESDNPLNVSSPEKVYITRAKNDSYGSSTSTNMRDNRSLVLTQKKMVATDGKGGQLKYTESLGMHKKLGWSLFTKWADKVSQSMPDRESCILSG